MFAIAQIYPETNIIKEIALVPAPDIKTALEEEIWRIWRECSSIYLGQIHGFEAREALEAKSSLPYYEEGELVNLQLIPFIQEDNKRFRYVELRLGAAIMSYNDYLSFYKKERSQIEELLANAATVPELQCIVSLKPMNPQPKIIRVQ